MATYLPTSLSLPSLCVTGWGFTFICKREERMELFYNDSNMVFLNRYSGYRLWNRQFMKCTVTVEKNTSFEYTTVDNVHFLVSTHNSSYKNLVAKGNTKNPWNTHVFYPTVTSTYNRTMLLGGGVGIGPHSNGFLLQTNTTTQQCSPQHDRTQGVVGSVLVLTPGALSAVVSVVRLVLARFYPGFLPGVFVDVPRSWTSHLIIYRWRVIGC
jgi:hypothetical protein